MSAPVDIREVDQGTEGLNRASGHATCSASENPYAMAQLLPFAVARDPV
jgi:hypothetical protein